MCYEKCLFLMVQCGPILSGNMWWYAVADPVGASVDAAPQVSKKLKGILWDFLIFTLEQIIVF